jgi:hypothetical protein
MVKGKFIVVQIFSLLVFCCLTSLVYSQTPESMAPSVAPILPNGVIDNNPFSNNVSTYSTTSISRNNQMIMQEVESNEAKRRQKVIYEDYNKELNASGIQYTFPSLNHPSKKAYFDAFKELQAMVEGETAIDLKRAVFITENAYLNNSMEYSDYLKAISHMLEVISLKQQQDGYPMDIQVAKMHTLHKFVSDTFSVKFPGAETDYTHYPMTYDFDDFRGEENYTKQFVSKLIVEGSGQCHSMPLLFLILAQEYNTEAYLAFAPSHSYIKFPDDNGNWHNLELTNGMLTSEAFIMESGYIKAEALISKIFMDTINMRQTIAYTMVDLVKGYIRKYGYDKFVLEATNYAIEQNNSNVFAHMLKANYYTALSMYVVKQMGYPKPEIVFEDEKARDLFILRDESYNELERVGYEEIPKEVYASWLKSLEKEKMKQAQKSNTTNLRSSF